MQVKIGIMGKHPGFGDFLAHGLSDQTRTGLDTWLSACLPALKEQAGGGWQTLWDNAPTLRFWIGRALAGCTLAGVFVPSRDKVGRLFPLLLLAEGIALQPPTVNAAQDFYEALEAHLSQVKAGQGGSSLLEGLAIDCDAEPTEAQNEGPVVWAHHPDGDLGALLKAAAPLDHQRAATARSYWWAPSRACHSSAIWLAQAGMPGTEAMGWLLSGHHQSAETSDA